MKRVHDILRSQAGATSIEYAAIASLISIAAYRGLWHLITKPFHWEKTAHGLSSGSNDHA